MQMLSISNRRVPFVRFILKVAVSLPNNPARLNMHSHISVWERTSEPAPCCCCSWTQNSTFLDDSQNAGWSVNILTQLDCSHLPTISHVGVVHNRIWIKQRYCSFFPASHFSKRLLEVFLSSSWPSRKKQLLPSFD